MSFPERLIRAATTAPARQIARVSLQLRQESSYRVLAATSLVHLLNDACFAILYPLLPLIAADLGLDYVQVGLIKTVFSGASSVLQIPAGLLGAQIGEYTVLLVGNLWVGIGVVAMATAASYGLLLAVAALAGLGGNAQHPLANSIVSQRVPRSRLATALGTLNFAGDLGKFAGPVIAGVIAVSLGWRAALATAGALAAVASVGLLLRRGGIAASVTRPPETHGEADRQQGGGETIRSGFPLLLLAGSLDNSTRGAALTFLPFVLAGKGLTPATISLLFSLIFAGGATGKFICGWLTERWGTLAVVAATELVTAGALLGFLLGPAVVIAPLSIVFGFALNGTSSAFAYGVTQFVPERRRSREYGTYFTATLVSSAAAPLAYGWLGDATNLTVVFTLMAALTLSVILAVLPIRGAFAE